MNLQRTSLLNQSSTLALENELSFSNENNRFIFGDKLISLTQDPYNQDEISLRIRNPQNKEDREYEDYIEKWEGNNEGLIWGSKEAKDKSWKEEWIEQRNIPKKSSESQISSSESEEEIILTNDTQKKDYVGSKCEDIDQVQEKVLMKKKITKDKRASLGQLTGINYKENRRWKEKWFRRGNKLFVRKCIEQLCEDNVRVIKTWYEDSEFKYEKKHLENDGQWKLVRINKYGRDTSNFKEWKEYVDLNENYETATYQERSIDSTSSSSPFFFIKKTKRSLLDNSKIIYKKYRRGYENCDILGIEIDSNEPFFKVSSCFSKNEIDNFNIEYSDKKATMDNKNSDFEKVEIWEEYIEIDCDGNKKGKKSGIDSNNVEWYEIWFEKIDGTRENDSWFIKEGKQWGEKNGYSRLNNENFKVKWEETKDVNNFENSKFIEKTWEKVGENNSWGESFREITEYVENKDEKINKKVETKKENWYNNGIETFKEEHFEKLEYENEFVELKNREIPVKVSRNGKKRGKRVTTGEIWCEDWEEDLERSINDKELIRTNHFTNKWWNNGNGNEWGEIRTLKLKSDIFQSSSKKNEQLTINSLENRNSYLEKVETWQKSEFEEFFDCWEIDGLSQNGHKKGIDKKQGNNSYIEWEEDWKKDNLENFNKNCIWRHYDEYGLIEVWEEKQILEKSGKCNLNKWGTKYNTKNRDEIEQEWQEEFENDGKGNTHTIKQGKGRESWYIDEFGESELTGEQWAHKQGYDKEGRWNEKWSERPDYKEAWKKGENCYGDSWEEEWKEDFKSKWKWAQKSGQNSIGDEWREEWKEEIDTINNVSRKRALKKGKKLHSGEEWSEEWGESYYGIGNEYMGDGGRSAEFVEKWTNKYASDGSGNFWGSSWGDNWRWDSKVKSWGETWKKNEIIEKW